MCRVTLVGNRPQIVVRDADREDAAALVRLWSECASTGGESGTEAFTHQALWREPGVPEAAEAIELNLARPGKRILIALVEGEVVGATVCDLMTMTPISLSRVLLVTDIQVSPRFRRRSVAATLLAAVADYGDQHQCEIVVASIPAQAREPHRYLTKLGFNQIAVVRAISPTKLQSRLRGKSTHSRDTGKLIAMRRTLRRRDTGRTPTA